MKRYKDKDTEFEYLRNYSFGARLTKIVTELIKYGAFVAIAWFVREMVGDLAGKITTANISISIWDKVLGVVFGGGGVLYGYKEKQFRKETTERLQDRIVELESMIDKNRSSSGLTPLGETNPEDL